jgi:thiosulfate/3-mercaptopyruvate sulfurtransferase
MLTYEIMSLTTFVDTATLAARLHDASSVVVDCRFKLDDPAWGAREYEASHIPGAVYADLDRDLAGPKTGTNGRHPLPAPAVFSATLGTLGIGRGMQVFAYDQDVGMYASRLWWMLRWLGHSEVAVLDGGFAKWIAENRPTGSGRESRPPRTFAGVPRPEMVAGADEVAALTGRGGWLLLDARAPERFSGQTETIDKKAGHIPGAANHFFRLNVDERNTLRAAQDVRARFVERLGEVPPERVVCYCGSGVTACQNLLAMEHVGLHGARLYPGSWSEWSSDPSRPTDPE